MRAGDDDEDAKLRALIARVRAREWEEDSRVSVIVQVPHHPNPGAHGPGAESPKTAAAAPPRPSSHPRAKLGAQIAAVLLALAGAAKAFEELVALLRIMAP